ncbi:MAG: ATP-dependent helicase [marine bacterium B5-7]|nr:MAG: ATP-dependent helicase [marine bacterium B5-7]
MDASILIKVQADDTVLTPTRRLASTLLAEYATSTCALPHCLPINAWLNQCWQQALAHGDTHKILLSDAQAKIIWQRIIQEDSAGEMLLNLTACADSAWQAWHTLNHWSVDWRDNFFQTNEDCLAFQHWAYAYVKQCQENHWIDSATLPLALHEIFKEKPIWLAKKLFITGFDEITPAIEKLLAAIPQRETLSENKPTKNIGSRAFATPELEFSAALAWAKAHYTDNPTANIGIIHPDLSTNWMHIKHRCEQVFPSENPTDIINLSGGFPLLDLPIIQHALHILALHPGRLSFEEISPLLQSPYVAGFDTEQAARLCAEIQLREQTHVSKRHLIKLLAHHGAAQFKTQCEAMFSISKPNDRKPSSWANWCIDRLTAFGFPGECALTSVEFQAFEHFQAQLHALHGLDMLEIPAQGRDDERGSNDRHGSHGGAHPVIPHTMRDLHQMTAQQALQHLKQTCRQVFQPQGNNAAPIQLLGVLEAGGLNFDALWVMGCDDANWPQAAKPNPFIPYALQTEHSMPHANAARELAFSQRMTERFCQSASTVIFSYACLQATQTRQASALIREFFTEKIDDPILPEHIETITLETFSDDVGLPLQDQARGGSYLIKHQAACPFKAYATHRLQAEGLHHPQPGLAPHVRGTLVHDILHRIWQQLENQDALLSLTETQLQKIIQAAVKAGLENAHIQIQTSVSFTELEQQRLEGLMHRWMAVEKSRPPFKVLLLESRIPYTLGKLELQLQVDRLDELEDGTRLLIDYKTGNVNTINRETAWQIDRPTEPQLPLYALATQDVSAISFAQVNASSCGFRGLAANDSAIPGIQQLDEHVTWDKQLHAWEETLNHLAEQLQRGDAQVDPNDPNLTCQYCELQRLCRVNT